METSHHRAKRRRTASPILNESPDSDTSARHLTVIDDRSENDALPTNSLDGLPEEMWCGLMPLAIPVYDVEGCFELIQVNHKFRDHVHSLLIQNVQEDHPEMAALANIQQSHYREPWVMKLVVYIRDLGLQFEKLLSSWTYIDMPATNKAAILERISDDYPEYIMTRKALAISFYMSLAMEGRVCIPDEKHLRQYRGVDWNRRWQFIHETYGDAFPVEVLGLVIHLAQQLPARMYDLKKSLGQRHSKHQESIRDTQRQDRNINFYYRSLFDHILLGFRLFVGGEINEELARFAEELKKNNIARHKDQDEADLKVSYDVTPIDGDDPRFADVWVTAFLHGGYSFWATASDVRCPILQSTDAWGWQLAFMLQNVTHLRGLDALKPYTELETTAKCQRSGAICSVVTQDRILWSRLTSNVATPGPWESLVARQVGEVTESWERWGAYVWSAMAKPEMKNKHVGISVSLNEVGEALSKAMLCSERERLSLWTDP